MRTDFPKRDSGLCFCSALAPFHLLLSIFPLRLQIGVFVRSTRVEPLVKRHPVSCRRKGRSFPWFPPNNLNLPIPSFCGSLGRATPIPLHHVDLELYEPNYLVLISIASNFHTQILTTPLCVFQKTRTVLTNKQFWNYFSWLTENVYALSGIGRLR